MEIGVGLPTTVPGADGRDIVDFARRADRLGFSTLAVFDRIVFDNYDSLVALGAAAAVTERIRLATTVLLAAYRPSVVELAKQLASIDRLSGGRLTVGVAAGGRADDFEATGTAFADRGRRLDGIMLELQRIWSGETGGLEIGPRPVQSQIPFWVGGHSPGALRRAARHAVGWVAPGGSVAGFPHIVRRARDAFSEAGRVKPPRVLALATVALGEDRRAASDAYVLNYYGHLGPKAEDLARAVIRDEGRLRELVDGYAAGGCDELLLFPSTADPEHLDLIAKAAL